jgi:hypothetical protein
VRLNLTQRGATYQSRSARRMTTQGCAHDMRDSGAWPFSICVVILWLIPLTYEIDEKTMFFDEGF